MASTKPPVVVYDACVLFPLNLRNVLVQCAEDRVVDARWTDDIHVEWIENLLQHDDRLDRARLERTRNLMKRVLSGADVQGYQYLIDGLTLADPDDRHVLAAAIHARADVILSADRGFTNAVLAPYGLTVERPDGFLMRLYHQDPDLMMACMANARRNLRNSEPSPQEFLGRLRKCGLGGFCDLLAGHLSEI